MRPGIFLEEMVNGLIVDRVALSRCSSQVEVESLLIDKCLPFILLIIEEAQIEEAVDSLEEAYRCWYYTK